MNLKTVVRRAYKSTAVSSLNDMLKQRTKWLRRRTIAQNKLDVIEADIIALATQLALEKVGITEDKADESR